MGHSLELFELFKLRDFVHELWAGASASASASVRRLGLPGGSGQQEAGASPEETARGAL